jgi:hypothetical protein
MRSFALALAAALTLIMPAAPVQASSRLSWVANGWDIHELDQLAPAAAAWFYDTPASYGTSPNPAVPTVKDGFTTTPVADYASYARFASGLAAGTISPAFRWVMYDPEEWSATPPGEQQDPGKYLKLFGRLAHADGYRVIEAPARDLGNVDTSCPKQPGETLDTWYIRCGIAGEAAADSDMVDVQTQADTTSLPAYDWLFSNAADQIARNNPSCVALAEVSTTYGTAAQMAAAARSVTAGGYYVSISEPLLGQAAQFFQDMQAPA